MNEASENAKRINFNIATCKADGGIDTNLISDGYHTMGELYDHRIALFVALCKAVRHDRFIWKSGLQAGYFLMGINLDVGKQISYHLPEDYWEETSFCPIIPDDSRYRYDGHTSADVLERLKNL